MDSTKYCQSCSMPLDNPQLSGTEKDGSPSNDYCKYCYKDGEFTSPGVSLDQMKERMSKMMDKEKLPADILEAAVGRLSNLKRWKSHLEVRNQN